MGKLDCLRNLSLFANLSDSDLDEIASGGEVSLFREGEILCHEGEPANKVYVLKRGRVRMYTLSEDGRVLDLDYMTQGGILGEEAAFGRGVYSMHAQTIEPTCALVFTRDGLERIFRRNPEIAIKVIQGLGQKLAQWTEMISEFALHDTRSRIIHALTRLAATYGTSTPEGVRIRLKLTHQDLANLVSVSRTTATTVLVQLRDEGLIRIEDREIILLPTLKRMGNQDMAKSG